MATRGESYSFLKKLLEIIKTTVDAQEPSNSEANKNIYAACDLAMGVLANKVDTLARSSVNSVRPDKAHHLCVANVFIVCCIYVLVGSTCENCYLYLCKNAGVCVYCPVALSCQCWRFLRKSALVI